MIDIIKRLVGKLESATLEITAKHGEKVHYQTIAITRELEIKDKDIEIKHGLYVIKTLNAKIEELVKEIKHKNTVAENALYYQDIFAKQRNNAIKQATHYRLKYRRLTDFMRKAYNTRAKDVMKIFRKSESNRGK